MMNKMKIKNMKIVNAKKYSGLLYILLNTKYTSP